jgi:type IX secretion system PorP/SprF family membrane protein
MNPAYVGVTDGYYVKGGYTTQWLGFDGAPQTQTFDFQRLLNNEKYAVGLSMLNDNFGAVQSFNLEGNYALHLFLTDEIKIALGLKFGINKFTIDYNSLDIFNPLDDVFANGNLYESRLILGTGFYIYKENWFVGASVPNLMQHLLNDELGKIIYLKEPWFYVSAGYNLELSRDWTLRNQVLMQLVESTPYGVFISSKMMYQNTFGIGLNYQVNGLVGAVTSFTFNSGVTLTYAYDLATTQLASYSSGNHTIGVSFRLESKRTGIMDRYLADKPYTIY